VEVVVVMVVVAEVVVVIVVAEVAVVEAASIPHPRRPPVSNGPPPPKARNLHLISTSRKNLRRLKRPKIRSDSITKQSSVVPWFTVTQKSQKWNWF
jgi:hypothetical protein